MKAAPYLSGWCAGANDPRAGQTLRGTNGHRRCTSTKCACICHGINVAADRALTITKEPTP